MSDVGSWKGKPMMNPEGKIGTVIRDNKSRIYRILTVEFEDKTTEELWLANAGDNPQKSRKWKWLFEHEGKSKWTEWGR